LTNRIIKILKRAKSIFKQHFNGVITKYNQDKI